MQITQKELHELLRAEAIASREKIASLTRALDSAKLNEHPEPNGWSVGQVLEHLLVADESYKAPLVELLGKARHDAAAVSRSWKPSLLGRLIAGGVSGSKPLKAPKVFDPGPTPRSGVVESLLSHETDFLRAMDDAMSYDWRALKLGSPALPKWAPKMNLGDGFRIHVLHLTRHSRQIERVARKL